MNWKSLKREILNKYPNYDDETKFILGIDIGDSTSAVSYWNVNLKSAQLIDVSGGYGNPAMPTVVQYIPENKEWVFGEYALLNRGYFNDYTFTNLVERLGKRESVEVEGRSISVVQLLGRYIKTLISNCSSINPNAEIGGVVAAIPAYMSEEAKDEFMRAIAAAGIDREFIEFVTDRECAIKYYHNKDEIKNEKVVILDYGSRELRGGIYEINPQDGKININALSSMIEEKISMKNIGKELKKLFTGYYCEQFKIKEEDINSSDMAQLESFVYQNRYTLFQNNGKNLKLYFNFAFPAFQKTITAAELAEFIAPIKNEFKHFLYSVCNKSIDNVKSTEIKKVICIGGGFEMKWTRNVIEEVFQEAEIETMKNSKGIISQGACISAAAELGLLGDIEYNFKDYNVVEQDIGLKALWNTQQQFIPFIHKGDFWWESGGEKVFIVDEEKDITIYTKDSLGQEIKRAVIDLKELPERPSKTTRLKIKLNFEKYNLISVNIKDYGFGEFFEASDFEKNIEIKL